MEQAGNVKISSVNPTFGIVGQTKSLTIIGRNFTAYSTVNLTQGSIVIPATNVVTTGSTKITCKVAIPSGSLTGPYDIFVVNGGGTVDSLPGGFTILNGTAPTISSLNPSTMYPNATWSFTIIGNKFQTGASVLFNHPTYGSIPVSTTVVSPTNITGTFTIPLIGTTGLWNITVTNPDSGSITKKNVLTVKRWPKPTLTSIKPLSMFQNTSTEFIITGNYFKSDTTVFFNKTSSPDITSSDITVVSPTKITGKINIPITTAIGLWNMVVTTPDGGKSVKSNALKIAAWLPPQIGRISPSSGISGSPFTFKITGNNFESKATTVIFYKEGSTNVPATDVNVIDMKTLTGNATLTTRGIWNILVTTADGGSTPKKNAFTVK